jgi:hypothetical protein
MTGKQYVDLLLSLYETSEKDTRQLESQESEYELALVDYEDNAIKNAVQTYWRYKSDKVRPNLAKILAILETEKDALRQIDYLGNKDELNSKFSFQIQKLKSMSCWYIPRWRERALENFWIGNGIPNAVAFKNFQETIEKTNNDTTTQLERLIEKWLKLSDCDNVTGSARKVAESFQTELRDTISVINGGAIPPRMLEHKSTIFNLNNFGAK